jgi:hypothetical protein
MIYDNGPERKPGPFVLDNEMQRKFRVGSLGWRLPAATLSQDVDYYRKCVSANEMQTRNRDKNRNSGKDVDKLALRLFEIFAPLRHNAIKRLFE